MPKLSCLIKWSPAILGPYQGSMCPLFTNSARVGAGIMQYQRRSQPRLKLKLSEAKSG